MISSDTVQAAGIGTDLDSDLIDAMIARAVAWVQTQTHRYFGTPGETVEYHAGTGRYELYLNERVREDDSDDFPVVLERCTPSSSTSAITAFEVRDHGTASVLVRTDGCVWGAGYEYTTTYRRGYVVDLGPADIEQVLLDFIALKINTQGAEGMRSESLAGYSYERAETASNATNVSQVPGAAATINAWRRPVFR